ncbi:MAG TPA: hypothetical protein VFC33_18055 [Acidimicrobiia bacterium]|nr:hypothetical protein [Acidimicrobiia bacterium]
MTAVLSLPDLPAFTSPTPAADSQPLATRVAHALRAGGPVPVALLGAAAHDERDGLIALLTLQDAGRRAARNDATQTVSPILRAVRGRLERDLVETLGAGRSRRAGDPVSTLRVIANAGALPDVYRWVASSASWRELVAFLAIEHVTSAADPDGDGASIATLSRDDMPTDALRILALDGMLTADARRDGECTGARAVTILRRPARSRQVVAALRRLRAPAAVLPYHWRHARCDPRVAQRRVAEEVAPLASSAAATQAVVRGARWRDAAERRLFAELGSRFSATR